MNIEQHTPFIDPGVQSVTDDRDVLDISDVETRYYFFNGTEVISVNEIDTSILGIYYIYYTISDRSGNEGLAIRTINVYLPDRIPPVITLLGDEVMTIGQYYDFVDSGVTAHDNIDGDITDKVVTIGTINTNIIGSQSIKYIISDQAGNTASVSRVVNVVEVIYVLPQRTGQTSEMHNFWNDMRVLNPREIIFQQGEGPSLELREEFERSYQQFLINGTITEEEYEELWTEFFGTRFRRVRAPLSTGHVETFVVIGEDDIPRQYIQSKSGKVYSPINSGSLFSANLLLEKISNLNVMNTELTTNMNSMFHNTRALESLNVSNFDTSNVTTMNAMFSETRSLSALDLSNFDTSRVTNMERMFFFSRTLLELDLSNFDTSGVTNMEGMFSSTESLINLDISNFDTSNVTTMANMFAATRSLPALCLDHFDTSNVMTMSSMFSAARSLSTLDLSNFDTSKVTNMSAMFSQASSLNTLDLSNFDTSKVTTMTGMFQHVNLTYLDISSFDTSNVTTMNAMFNSARRLEELDLSHFDTSRLTSMSNMFFDTRSLTMLNISSFDTSNVTNMSWMFGQAYVLEKITFSEKFIIPSASTNSIVNVPTSSHTGHWINSDNTQRLTSNQLWNFQRNTPTNDTWIWERR